ncbi:MAG: caspase family protein [Williamsia sp.]|nr:caspase family protein [Williamsia sp.]
MLTYALLVGINNYNKIRNLSGCINDTEQVGNYLSRYAPASEVKKLLNDRATKHSIVEAFRSYTKIITASDSFLFYFSGHGTREEADPLWHEVNGYLECIVCYDQDPDSPCSYLLADKEMRYLIFELAKTGCHIAMIFDCCHAGGNTRYFELVQEGYGGQDVRERRYAATFPRRTWKEFIFGSFISEESAYGKSPNEFLPQGTHVQIGACEADEYALEVDGAGVFTKTLLKVLQDTGGNISYYNLQSRIRNYLRFAYKQQPRVYAVGKSDEETRQQLFNRFLNYSATADQFIAEAVFNSKRGWLLNLGAIHGISENTNISLVDPVSSENYQLSPQDIYIDHSTWKPALYSNIPTGATALKAMAHGLAFPDLKLHIAAGGYNLKKQKSIADELTNQAKGYFTLTEKETEAAYSLHILPQCMYLTYPGEVFRPIARPIEISQAVSDSSSDIAQLIEDLNHLSRWTHIRQLQNKVKGLLDEDLIKASITQIHEDGAEDRLSITRNNDGSGSAILAPYTKGGLRIQLTNGSNQKLYIAAVYLSYNFRVYTDFLETGTELLNPGSSVALSISPGSGFAVRKDFIPIQLSDVVKEYNWPAYSETLKIIVSSEDFNHEVLRLDALPSPYILKDRFRQLSSHKSFDFDDDDPATLEGWITQTIHLVHPNALYNKTDKETITEMAGWDKTAFFAAGLYPEKKHST